LGPHQSHFFAIARNVKPQPQLKTMTGVFGAMLLNQSMGVEGDSEIQML